MVQPINIYNDSDNNEWYDVYEYWLFSMHVIAELHSKGKMVRQQIDFGWTTIGSPVQKCYHEFCNYNRVDPNSDYCLLEILVHLEYSTHFLAPI